MIRSKTVLTTDSAVPSAYTPQDLRALIAVDLGAESCRVSLLRWLHGKPHFNFRAITGLQLHNLNTVYQLYADRLASQPAGDCWLNLPEYLLARWGGTLVAEYTNATHTQMVQLEDRAWSRRSLRLRNWIRDRCRS